MKNLTDTVASPDGAWQGSDHHASVPDTSMLTDATQSGAPAVDLMRRVVRGAHTTLDELADSAEPTVRQVGETVSSAQEALQAKATRLRAAGEEWAEGARATVRSHPLACVLAALALGALVGRARR
jgi:2-keto-4-pentenoate hydratase